MHKTLETISSAVCYNTWMYNNIKRYLHGNVLDIGSGIGDIAEFYYGNDNVQTVILSDYCPEMIGTLNKKFSGRINFVIREMNISDDGVERYFEKNYIDTITCLNVLEHIEDDGAALRNMHKILKPEGKLILVVPAFQFLYGSLDRLVGHHRRYGKLRLNKILKDANFDIVEQRYMNVLGMVSWFVSGRLLRSKEFNRGTCENLDKIVPILENIEKILTPPAGQSLITVLRKK